MKMFQFFSYSSKELFFLCFNLKLKLQRSGFGFHLVLRNENHSCCGVQLVWRGEDKVAPLYNDQLHSPGNGTNSLLLRELCEP